MDTETVIIEMPPTKPTKESINLKLKNAFYLHLENSPNCYFELSSLIADPEYKLNIRCEKRYKQMNYLQNDGTVNPRIKALVLSIE